MQTSASIESSWPDAIYAHFRRVGIRQVGYVPDAGHSRLIALCQADPNIADVVLTTEEEGVGLVAGAALGGQRAALLMQSSGVGNCINMFSLLRNCGFGCVVLVTMRGEFGEFNPWQVPMGSITEEVLRLSGFLTYRIENADDVDDIVGAGCDMAFDGNLQVAHVAVAAVDRPQAMGRNDARPARIRRTASDRPRRSSGRQRARLARPTMSPRPAIIRSISICGARWAAATMIGLGLALARPERASPCSPATATC